MIRVGKIVAIHGLQGAVILKHIVEQEGWLKKDSVLFLELQKHSYIPYFVIAAKDMNDEEVLVTFEDLDDPATAKKLIGKNVYVKQEELAETGGDSPLLWIGFEIVDKKKGSLGKIEDMMQAGPQWIAKLTIREKEVLIPMVPDLITDISIKKKQIKTDLPDGLIEVYLEAE